MGCDYKDPDHDDVERARIREIEARGALRERQEIVAEAQKEAARLWEEERHNHFHDSHRSTCVLAEISALKQFAAKMAKRKS